MSKMLWSASHVIGLLGLIGCSRSTSPAPTLTAADRAAIATLDSAFVSAWLRDDTAAVLGVFAPDAILFPPGSTPLRGIEAIKAYWWPTDGSHTKITGFTRVTDELAGTGTLAYQRSTASLSWEFLKDGKQTAQTSRSIDLLLMQRDSSGQWRVFRQIWSQLPSQ